MIDFMIHDHGTVILFEPLTDVAKRFVAECVNLEDWQKLGTNQFALDHRIAHNFIQILKEEEFTFIAGMGVRPSATRH